MLSHPHNLAENKTQEHSLITQKTPVSLSKENLHLRKKSSGTHTYVFLPLVFSSLPGLSELLRNKHYSKKGGGGSAGKIAAGFDSLTAGWHLTLN